MKLELRQEQRLSQRQIQSLHLLQMGWMELENTLSQLAEENPLIDLDASHFYHADVSPFAAYPGSTYRPPLEDEAPSPLISPPQMEGCMRLCRVTCSGKSRHYLSPRKKAGSVLPK